jgi:hypothetical protein
LEVASGDLGDLQLIYLEAWLKTKTCDGEFVVIGYNRDRDRPLALSWHARQL